MHSKFRRSQGSHLGLAPLHCGANPELVENPERSLALGQRQVARGRPGKGEREAEVSPAIFVFGMPNTPGRCGGVCWPGPSPIRNHPGIRNSRRWCRSTGSSRRSPSSWLPVSGRWGALYEWNDLVTCAGEHCRERGTSTAWVDGKSPEEFPESGERKEYAGGVLSSGLSATPQADPD